MYNDVLEQLRVQERAEPTPDGAERLRTLELERANLLETKERFAKEKEDQEEELRVMNQKM